MYAFACEMHYGSVGSEHKRTHSKPFDQIVGANFGGGQPKWRAQIEQQEVEGLPQSEG